MKYQPTFPKCPYRAKGSKYCSNKSIKGNCPYEDPQKPERCKKYREHIKDNKIDSRAVSDDMRAMGVKTND